MALAIAVKEAFAELFSKSDRIPFQTLPNFSNYEAERE